MGAGFPGGSAVKNPLAMQEAWVQYLGWEDPLEEGMKPSSVSLPGEFHGQRSLVDYSPQSRKELDTTEQLTLILEKIRITLAKKQTLPTWIPQRLQY